MTPVDAGENRRGASLRVLLEGGFRPFFLLAALFGAVLPLHWVGLLSGWWGGPDWLTPIAWHGHEMLFGFASAAIAGFLLTAVPVWTGSPPIAQGRLAALVVLWLAGRLAMIAAGFLPPWLVALLDLPFLPALAVAVGRPIYHSPKRRNDGFPLLLLAVAVANGWAHLAAMGEDSRSGDLALRGVVFAVALLIAWISGRIVPLFTANALRRSGGGGLRTGPWTARLVLPVFGLAALVELWPGAGWLAGVAGGAAAGVLLLRQSGWRSLRALRDPLLGSLHIGHLWLPVGWGLLAAGHLGAPIPASLGLHALTTGGIGMMVLAVSSRVALAHTGRPLKASRPVASAYGMVTAAALLRVAGPLLWPHATLHLLQLSALLWSGAFLAFLGVYAPILWAPRRETAAQAPPLPAALQQPS